MEPSETVLVTGATGFVGAAVGRALARRGITPRVLARPSSDHRNLQDFPCRVAVGDITDYDAVARAMQGVDAVFHVAADYRLWVRHKGELLTANVEGTRVVMRAAKAAGVRRVVHTSSVATLRPGGDESGPLSEREAIGAYKRSKVAAERMVERMAAEEGLPAVIVNPSTPIGPGDVKPTPTGRILVEAARGRMPAFVDTGLNLAHVDDIAEGHLLALEKGRIGERYVLGGENVSLRELLAEIAAQTGRRAPTLSLPRAPLYPLALAAESAARLTGRQPFLSRDALKMAAHRMYFSSDKAEAELGYRHRPWRDAVAEALAWFRDEGRI